MATHLGTNLSPPRLQPGAARVRPRFLPGSIDEMDRCCRALEAKQAQGDVHGMATCCLQLGDLFLRRGDAELAEEMYRRALSLSRILSGATEDPLVLSRVPARR